MERELERCRAEVNGVNRERKAAQERKRGELEAGEREWKVGVGELVQILLVGGRGRMGV